MERGKGKMIKVLEAVLILFGCGGLIWELTRRTRKLKEQQSLLDARQSQIEALQTQSATAARELEKLRQEVWQSANTIHFYAALSQENIPPTQIKENQQAIQAQCEQIFSQL